MNKNNSRSLWIAGSLLIAVAAVGAAIWNGWGWFGPSQRRVLLAELVDPDSARFRNEKVTKDGYLCGEFNAKNKMGGYGGFTRYMAHENGILLIDGESNWRAPREGATDHKNLVGHLRLELEILDNSDEVRKEDNALPVSQRHGEEWRNEEAHRRTFAGRWAKICN